MKCFQGRSDGAFAKDLSAGNTATHIQRANNRQACFAPGEDFSNDAHLLATPTSEQF